MSYGTIRTNTTLLFGICCLAYIANGLLTVLPASSLSMLAQNTHVSLSTAGLTFTLSSFGSILAVILSSVLIKKVGAKLIILLGLGGLTIASILIPTTHSFNVWLLAQLVQGISNGFISIGLTITVTLNFADQLNEKLNLLYGSNGIGALLAPIILSWTLSLTHALLGSFVVVAVSGLLALLATASLVFLSKPVANAQQQAVPGSAMLPPQKTSKILKQTLFWLMALQVCFYVGAESGFSNWLVTSLSQSSDITLQMATPAATLFWVGETFGRLLVAQLMRHGYLTQSRLLYVSIIGGALSGVLVTTFLDVPRISFIASFCMGFWFGPIYPTLQSMATRRFARTPALASSLVLVSTGFAGMTIPLSIGMLLPILGIRGGMLIPAILCLAITVPFYLANRQEQQQVVLYQEQLAQESAEMPVYELPTMELPVLTGVL